MLQTKLYNSPQPWTGSHNFLEIFLLLSIFKMEIFSMFGEPLTQNFKKLVNHLLRNVSVEALPSCFKWDSQLGFKGSIT
jgi:hypothetical protein